MIKPKAFFNKKGDLIGKIGMKFGGQMKPQLSVREWWYWILINSEDLSPAYFEELLVKLVGSASTVRRIKLLLAKKKYI